MFGLVYSWIRVAVTMLCMTYHRAHCVSCIVTRVEIWYGARMRSDKLPARLILNVLNGRAFSEHIWTEIDSLDGNLLICSMFHMCNRVAAHNNPFRVLGDVQEYVSLGWNYQNYRLI